MNHFLKLHVDAPGEHAELDKTNRLCVKLGLWLRRRLTRTRSRGTLASFYGGMIFLAAVFVLPSCVSGDRDGTSNRPFSISGQVRLGLGGLADVVLVFQGTDAPSAVTTDANGFFERTDVPAGTFVVTPTHSLYDFYEVMPDYARSVDLSPSATVDTYTNPLVEFVAVPAGASLDLLSPNGGGMLLAGETTEIMWRTSSLGGTTVTIEYLDDSMIWNTIATDVALGASDLHSYSWTPPADLDASNCRIRMTSDDHPDAMRDMSDEVFSVRPDTAILGMSTTAGVLYTFQAIGGAPAPPSAQLLDGVDIVIASGTAASGSANTLVDRNGLDAHGLYVGATLAVAAGASPVQSRTIIAFGAVTLTLTVGTPFSPVIDAASRYEVLAPAGWFKMAGLALPATGSYTYRVTPTKAGTTFTPASQDVVVDSSGYHWLPEPFASDAAPLVIIVATDPAAAEAGPDPGEFTVSRTGDVSAPLTVSFLVGGTGAEGVDYALVGASVTIAGGQASATIALSVIDDALAEGAETVVVALVSGPGYSLATPSSATISIADDD